MNEGKAKAMAEKEKTLLNEINRFSGMIDRLDYLASLSTDMILNFNNPVSIEGGKPQSEAEKRDVASGTIIDMLSSNIDNMNYRMNTLEENLRLMKSYIN